MKLTRYLYLGPNSSASLRVGDGKGVQILDVRLQTNRPVELPADHEYTQVLLTLRHLRPLPEQPAAIEPATDKKGGKA